MRSDAQKGQEDSSSSPNHQPAPSSSVTYPLFFSLIVSSSSFLPSSPFGPSSPLSVVVAACLALPRRRQAFSMLASTADGPPSTPSSPAHSTQPWLTPSRLAASSSSRRARHPAGGTTRRRTRTQTTSPTTSSLPPLSVPAAGRRHGSPSGGAQGRAARPSYRRVKSRTRPSPREFCFLALLILLDDVRSPSRRRPRSASSLSGEAHLVTWVKAVPRPV